MCASDAYNNRSWISIIIIIIYLIYTVHSKADYKENHGTAIMQDELNKLNETDYHIRHNRHKLLEIEELPSYLMPLVDMTCISHGIVKAPSIKNGKIVRYLHRKLPVDQTINDSDHKGFLIAIYNCLDGYEFEKENHVKMYCSKRKLIGKKPKCRKFSTDHFEQNDDAVNTISIDMLNTASNSCSIEFRKTCKQDCIVESGKPICTCYSGYILQENNCIDINECANENIRNVCTNGCVNTQGSYHCIQKTENLKEINEEVGNGDIHYVVDKIYDVEDDEQNSGSGDYVDEDYSEENNENEDDEDYGRLIVYKNNRTSANKESNIIQSVIEEELTTKVNMQIKEKNDFVTEESSTTITSSESHVETATDYSYNLIVEDSVINNKESKEGEFLIDTNNLNKMKEVSDEENNKNIINIKSSTEILMITPIDNIGEKEKYNINTTRSKNELSNLNSTGNQKENANGFEFQIRAITSSGIENVNKIEENNRDNYIENYDDNYNDNDEDYYNEKDYKENQEATSSFTTTVKSQIEDIIYSSFESTTTKIPVKKNRNNDYVYYDKDIEEEEYNSILITSTLKPLEETLPTENSFIVTTVEESENNDDSNDYYEINYNKETIPILTTTTNGDLTDTTNKYVELTTTKANKVHSTSSGSEKQKYSKDDYDNEVDYNQYNYNYDNNENKEYNENDENIKNKESDKNNENTEITELDTTKTTTIETPFKFTTEIFKDYPQEKERINNLEDIKLTTPIVVVIPTDPRQYEENKEVLKVFPTHKDMTTVNIKQQTLIENHTVNNEFSTLAPAIAVEFNLPSPTTENDENIEEIYDDRNLITTTPVVQILNATHSQTENINNFEFQIRAITSSSIEYENKVKENDKEENNKDINYSNNYDNNYNDNDEDYYNEIDYNEKDKETKSSFTTTTDNLQRVDINYTQFEPITPEIFNYNVNKILNISDHSNNYNKNKESDDLDKEHYTDDEITTTGFDTIKIKTTDSPKDTQLKSNFSSTEIYKENNLKEQNFIHNYDFYNVTIPQFSNNKLNKNSEDDYKNEDDIYDDYKDEYNNVIITTTTSSTVTNNKVSTTTNKPLIDIATKTNGENESKGKKDKDQKYSKTYKNHETTTLRSIYYDDKAFNKDISNESKPEEKDHTRENKNKQIEFTTIITDTAAHQILNNTNYDDREDYEQEYDEENYDSPNYDDKNYLETDNTKENDFYTTTTLKSIDADSTTITTIRSLLPSCSPGFLFTESNQCSDINECQEHQLCSHECENTIGSYRCLCPLGYTLSFENKHLCEDVNECLQEPCSHNCINENGNFRCECPENYYLFNQTTCVEINCSYDFIKLNNSIECICPTGFMLESDNSTCQDIDECTLRDLHNCSHICENIEGSFTCLCEDGYFLKDDSSTCEDINECDDMNLNNCHQICDNTKGSFSCDCFDGYKLTNSTHCQDIDECTIDNGHCSHFCNNSDGFYECSCPDGYYLMEDSKTCNIFNPCEINNGGCSDICLNENGQVLCTCPDGHEKINDNCILINICELNNGGCSHFCENNNGIINCNCPSSHTLANQTHCKEIDRCSIDNGGCTHICQLETNKNVVCSCPSGFELINNKTCLEINLCKVNNGNCSHICKFSNNEVECQCPIGYELFNKTTCVEENLCKVNNGGCSHNCFYNRKNIICSCPDNYELYNGTTCVEINPCLINNGGCSHRCEFENNSIRCSCPENTILADKICRVADPCKINNGGCSHICDNIHGEAFCRCPPGLKLLNRFCFQVNPCAMNNGGCSHLCSNINGTAQCSCPTGYKLRPNKRNCKEINYCRIGNGGCSHYCRNLHGSYECTCPYGYDLDRSNNKTCIDVNECLIHNGGCQQLCINLEGSHKCACREEYLLQKNRRSCRPVYISKCPALVPPLNGNTRCLQMYPNDTNFAPLGTQCVVLCDIGYKLKGESIKSCNSLGTWGDKPTYCVSVSCPKLGNVPRGKFAPDSCTEKRLFPGEMCSLKCNKGYRPSREFESITCLSTLQWSSIVSESRLQNACTQDTFEPFIRCPKGGSLTFTLPPGKNEMLVTIPKPDSNVDWWRYISSKPAWGMELSKNLPPGRTDVIYTARSPATNMTVSCRLIITVVDKEVPQVVNCPNNIVYTLAKHEYNKVIYWSEPEFSDNMEVVGIYKSKEPGTNFGPGTHFVYYIAHDAAGNQAKCHFTINIKASPSVVSRSVNDVAVLICPHGIQYVSKSSTFYNDEELKRQGCYWGHTRTRKPIQHRSYSVNSEKFLPENRNKRYHPLYWYNKCC